MPLISVREHERLRVGNSVGDGPVVTPNQAKQLRAFRYTHQVDVFRVVDDTTLAAQQYVGVAQVGTLTVEVLPKIEGIDSPSIRRNLIAMLAVALDLDIHDGEAARVACQSHGILEVLIRIYCDKLFVQVHKGLVHQYESRAENLGVVRGRISVIDQIRRNAANPERLFCRFDEFQSDTPLNRVFKASIQLLLNVSCEISNQSRLRELLLMLQDVSDVPRRALPWHLIEFDRLNQRFQSAFRLAELFLKSSPPDVSAGLHQSLSLFFDMNELFEEYVGRMAKRVLGTNGCKVKLQTPQLCLTYDEFRERDAIVLKPDIVGMVDHKPAWIIDTKWKQLTPGEVRDGVAQADIYQVFAYLSRYDCPKVILLYPHHNYLSGDAGIRGSYRVAGCPVGKEKRILIGTIRIDDLSTVPEQLRCLVRGASALPTGSEARQNREQQATEAV